MLGSNDVSRKTRPSSVTNSNVEIPNGSLTRAESWRSSRSRWLSPIDVIVNAYIESAP